MTKKELLAMCEQFFAYNSQSTEEFAAIVSYALGLDTGMELMLAVEFGAAKSTVHRWASGAANPHLLIRKQIITFIKQWTSDEDENKEIS